MDSPSRPPSRRCWSIHGRADVKQYYEILDRVGTGAYSDVYRGRRRSDGLTVALKEVHDYQSASREIEALQALRGAPNVVDLIEYFWQEGDDAVLVLEFLPVGLDSVVRDAKRRGGGIPTGELKQWMMQILRGVDACHHRDIVHRDFKPANLLISSDGVLKLADFGQARILQEIESVCRENSPHLEASENELPLPQESSLVKEVKLPWLDGPANQYSEESRLIYEDEYLQELDGIKAQHVMDGTEKETILHDGYAGCLAAYSTRDMEDNSSKGTYSYEAAYEAADICEDESGNLTSCVGTRWFRAPELLYGSTSYGKEIDLWSVGCILAELLSLQPLFPGDSDLAQIGVIFGVLGNINEDSLPGCSKLPDYIKLLYSEVKNPIGLEACMPNRSPKEVNLVRRLICYDPASRATALELLQDSYFSEEPLPVLAEELRVPSEKDGQEGSSGEARSDYRGMESDSDDEFGRMDVTMTEKGFSMLFS